MTARDVGHTPSYAGPFGAVPPGDWCRAESRGLSADSARASRHDMRKAVRRSDAGVVRVDVPKTASSVRVVTLPDPITDTLQAHLEEFVADGPAVSVFATGSGTIPARSNLGASWRRACATAGVPHVRLHDLRHLAQVYAAEAGATLPELMARLGHATPGAAMVYLHARPGRDTELAAALGRAISAGALLTRRDPSK